MCGFRWTCNWLHPFRTSCFSDVLQLFYPIGHFPDVPGHQFGLVPVECFSSPFSRRSESTCHRLWTLFGVLSGIIFVKSRLPKIATKSRTILHENEDLLTCSEASREIAVWAFPRREITAQAQIPANVVRARFCRKCCLDSVPLQICESLLERKG